MNRQAFVNTYGGFVRDITKGTGIYPETLFAQAVLESGTNPVTGEFPNSTLAREYKNLFGIKADSSWSGPAINLKTGEYTGTARAVTITDAFRVYDSYEDSMRDYVQFLLKNPRYRKAGVFNADSAASQAVALQNAGYATDANYSNLLISVQDKLKGWIPEEVKEAVAKTVHKIEENPLQSAMLVAGGLLIIAGGILLIYYSSNGSKKSKT